MSKLTVNEPENPWDGPIVISDENHNDVAEFFHNQHATVGQTYQQALAYAWALVGAINR